MEDMEITIVDHPLAASRLSIMRDKRTDNAGFRAALADLGAMLIYEASRELEVENFPMSTPVAETQGIRLRSTYHCSDHSCRPGHGRSSVVDDP